MSTKRLVSGPRVKALVIGPHEFQGRYKQHDLDLLRDGFNDNWYIRVRAPNGCYVYDGWWACSRGKPVKAAVAEACRGAGLWTLD